MAENPLNIIEMLDLELFKNVEATQTLALVDGVLPRKVKLLMAMALDASHGTVEWGESIDPAGDESWCYKGRDHGDFEGSPVH
jgi:hypothetical protein